MKQYRYLVLPSAKGDITACHEYLHERNPDAADRFLDAVEPSCSRNHACSHARRFPSYPQDFALWSMPRPTVSLEPWFRRF